MTLFSCAVSSALFPIGLNILCTENAFYCVNHFTRHFDVKLQSTCVDIHPTQPSIIHPPTLSCCLLTYSCPPSSTPSLVVHNSLSLSQSSPQEAFPLNTPYVTFSNYAAPLYKHQLQHSHFSPESHCCCVDSFSKLTTCI